MLPHPSARVGARSAVGGVCVLAALVVLAGAPAGVAQAAWPPTPVLEIPADRDAGRLPPSVRAVSQGDGRWKCMFRITPPAGTESVHLAGSFNNWSPTAQRLDGPDPAGVWATFIELPAGVHEYKFVLNGREWIADPVNPDGVPDNHGGQNSVARLGRMAWLKESTGRRGDGQIEGLALLHEPDRPLFRQYVSDGRVLLRLRTLAHDVERVAVTWQSGGEAELEVVTEDARFALWETVTPIPAASGADPVRYTFVLSDGALRAAHPGIFGVPVKPKDVFRTPDWAKHAVWYQIFPERFRNGDPSNDPRPTRPWTSEWFTPSEWEGKDGQTFYHHFVFERRYGGDLQGILEKLPYLKALGVNALYLNPVFKGESLHKYDATSYIHIDDHFGVKGDYERVAAQEDLLDPKTWQWTESDKLFLKLVRECHRQGLRVIIDGVFNHVGTAHPAFQDVKKNGPKSKYADWFIIESWEPFKYRGWAGTDALPEFRKDAEHGLASAAVREHIFAITRRWMDPDGDGDPRDGIDGWRLDVPNEVPIAFWIEWRKLVKSINPDAYITGEIWDHAEAWLDGRTFDAVMNYPFARIAVAWLFDQKKKVSASEADRRFRELRLAYPLEATLVMQNLMNSHDTDRLISMAFNPDREYDHGNRAQDNGPNYNNAKPDATAYARARLAALLQMTYVGAPMVYYGDEVGMWGGDDPNCRKPMLWEDLQPYDRPDENYVHRDQLAHYQRVIALRNAHPALRTGTIQTLLTDDATDVWAFLRKDADEQLIVALNSTAQSHEVTIPLPASAPTAWRGVYGPTDTLRATEQKLKVTVPALDGVVLHAATPK